MIITSVNNSHIKEICKLKEKKYRDSTDTYLIEGDHLVKEGIKNNKVKEIIALEGYSINSIIPVTYVTDNVMKKITSLDSIPEVIGIAYKNKDIPYGSKILILEDLQDPGNLGTIIRSSLAFDIDTIVVSPKTVDLYNPKVIRSCQGMIFNINILVKELEPFITDLKKDNYQILGTNVNNGINIKNIKVNNKFVIIIGNEGNGMSKDLELLCDNNIYIKMNERVESLNAAVAASIILYEINNGTN